MKIAREKIFLHHRRFHVVYASGSRLEQEFPDDDPVVLDGGVRYRRLADPFLAQRLVEL